MTPFISSTSLPRTRRLFVLSVLWLGPLLVGWAGYILLSHRTTLWTITWTQRLFGWMLLMTYMVFWSWAIGISRHPRLTLLRGVTWTITILGLLVCLEIPTFLKFVHWGLVFDYISGEPQNYVWAYQPDQELTFRRKPRDHWNGYVSSDIEFGWLLPRSRQEPLAFTYDKWGYRNPIDLDQADVALIGDSYVEGWYVSDRETTAQRLQTHLGRSVMNLGVAGYGTQQELRVLQQDAIRFHPRVVVFFFFEGNDLYDDYRFEQSFPAGAPSGMAESSNPHRYAWNAGWHQGSFTYNFLRRVRRLSHSLLPNHTPYVGYFAVPGQDRHPVYFADYAAVPWNDWVVDRWEKAQDTLTHVAEFSRSQGIHVLFAFVPIKFRVYQPFMEFDPESPCRAWTVWPITDRFSEFCRSANVPCLDLTGLFQQAVREGNFPYSSVDTHWSAQGHALVAELLASDLTRRGWLSGSGTQIVK